jgi:CRISPR-associated endonuclease Csn1
MRVMGLDLGTNSIGWAIVDDVGGCMSLVDKGAVIFEKGVGEEKNVEFSRASERTGYRAARRIKYRRKLRKLETLKVLARYSLAPQLSKYDLDEWRYAKHYPDAQSFREWLNCTAQSREQKKRNPYYCRYAAVTRKFDLNSETDRFMLGRAFYHLAQRRGYQSNRVAGEDKNGTVMGAIQELHEKMNGRTLGQYYFEESLGDEAVRGAGHYTHRKDYLDEFHRICEVQQLDQKMVRELDRAIFFQRPLKSQKGLIGKCPLEPKKPRIPISHPIYERFRVLQFINNIKVREPIGASLEPRFLNEEERRIALQNLLMQGKNEKFEKLVKKLLPKRTQVEYGGKYREADRESWVFNCRKDMAMPGAPFTAKMISVFGDNWENEVYARYAKAENKTKEQVVGDIWHALFSFDNTEKLRQFLVNNLKLDNVSAEKLAKPLPQGYGNLSLKATKNIMIWMEKGTIYSQAAFLGKLPEIFRLKKIDWNSVKADVEKLVKAIMSRHSLDSAIEFAVNCEISKLRDHEFAGGNGLFLKIPENVTTLKDNMLQCIQDRYGERRWAGLSDEQREESTSKAVSLLLTHASRHQGKGEYVKGLTLESRLKQSLADKYNFAYADPSQESELRLLYHPSAIEYYPQAQENQLGDPRINAIKNPVFMRSLFVLRRLINTLLNEGIIDKDTRIRVEMARELNNANNRAALHSWQRELEQKNAKYASVISENGYDATATNIVKYKLWMEQGKQCLYTGRQIGLHDFLGENPVFQIEHTVPRSRRLDNSQENMTLCEMHYNCMVKRNFLPQELGGASEILLRARHVYQPHIDELESQMERSRAQSRAAQDKESKDKARQKLLRAKLERDYLRGKLKRFELIEPPNGFTNNQLVDTRIISKYAVLYLKSLFNRVETLKANVVHEVKDIWGLKEKSRDNHVHHAIDAVVLACLNKKFYDKLASYYDKYERFRKYGEPMPSAPQPWDDFDRYMNAEIQNEIFIPHLHKDNTLKPTYKILRKRGKNVLKKNGSPVVLQGDTARGQLHQETVYGVIQMPPAKGVESQVNERKAVVRKFVRDLDTKDVDNIVDPVVREVVRANFENRKTTTIWLNKEKRVPVKKVRLVVRNKAESLIPIRKQRDQSRQRYKSHQMVANGSNYITGLYRGTINGKSKADWKVISVFDAVKARRLGSWNEIMPEVDEKGLALRYKLKSGTNVLFWKDSPDELKRLGNSELLRRLYRVAVMAGSRIIFNHNQTALSAGELGSGSSKIDWEGSANRLRLSVNNINIAVDGNDFDLDILGRINWKE